MLVSSANPLDRRFKLTRFLLIVASVVLTARLYYWQVINSHQLSVEAQTQRSKEFLIRPERGKILTRDKHTLVSNEPRYILFAYLPQLALDKFQISQSLASILIDPEPKSATEAAKPVDQRIQELAASLNAKLNRTDTTWVALDKSVSPVVKDQISQLNIAGLGFDEYSIRSYPEASMSAHLLGFVGKNDAGKDQGYFGLEGYYNRELEGRLGLISQETDAAGRPIVIGFFRQRQARNGRSLVTHLNRSLQFMVESHLQTGIEKYQAKSGEIVVMDPYTGAILAMAAFPSYRPDRFIDFPTSLYKNPIIANAYEPGSTFKVVVMAAALDAGVISPESTCDQTCAGPVTIGKYSIRTWNNQYFPGQTMQEVLSRSDNTGMVFVAFKLGKEKFIDYLHKFGFGQPTGIDLQEESSPPFRSNWGDIDLATASFGQGIAVTGIQMVTAVAAIANGGKLVEPHVVHAVIDGQEQIVIPPKIKSQVISPQTAQKVKDMMIASAHHGEAQWAVLKKYQVAGKTGTAQIPIAGHYDEEKTIASFVGFAPAQDPKFVMLVKLTEPQSSPWASETAAPLWFNLAHDLLVYQNVPPSN